jgi:hypothetical protein
VPLSSCLKSQNEKPFSSFCDFKVEFIKKLRRKGKDLLNMYLRISLRNFEEFSGSPKTAKMPHILTNFAKSPP